MTSAELSVCLSALWTADKILVYAAAAAVIQYTAVPTGYCACSPPVQGASVCWYIRRMDATVWIQSLLRGLTERSSIASLYTSHVCGTRFVFDASARAIDGAGSSMFSGCSSVCACALGWWHSRPTCCQLIVERFYV